MSEETKAVERDYYGNPIKDPFVIKQRRERREWLAGMTDEQKAAMAAGVETTRTEPVTKTGKALMACGLPWLEEDFKAEAEQKGVDVSKLDGYGASMSMLRGQRRRADAVGTAMEAVRAMRHEEMTKVYQAMLNKGFNPDADER